MVPAALPGVNLASVVIKHLYALAFNDAANPGGSTAEPGQITAERIGAVRGNGKTQLVVVTASKRHGQCLLRVE